MPNSELAKVLRVKEKNIRQHQSNHKADFVEGKGKDYWRGYLDVPNAPPMTLWSKEGAIKLAQHYRTSQAKAFLEEMGFTVGGWGQVVILHFGQEKRFPRTQ